MNMKNFACILLSCVLLSACASQSPYQAASGRGYGYKETQIGQQRYRVVFKARGDNSSAAMDYALLRAAELTLHSGYNWFEVVDRQSEVVHSDRNSGAQLSASRSRTNSSVRCGLLTCSSSPNHRTEYATGLNMGDERSKVVAQLEIWMDKGVRPDSLQAYSAGDVVDILRQRLINPE